MSQIYVNNVVAKIATLDAAANILFLAVAIDPRTGDGVSCGIGSIAFGPDGAHYKKTDVNPTDWAPASVAV